MSSVVSFKVPREIKEKMKKLEKHVKWSEELRNFLIDSQAMELARSYSNLANLAFKGEGRALTQL
jgi:hypothetical protein